MLEYVPASFKVIRTVRPKLSCGCCSRIVQEPAQHRPIDKGLAGPGLLAHVLVAKYADHMPLYRQSEINASTRGRSVRLAPPTQSAIDSIEHFAGTLKRKQEENTQRTRQ